MTEKVVVNDKDVWIVIEPLTVPRDNPDDTPTEYFMVFYNLEEPGSKPGELFREDDNRPTLFESPVAALAYANEKLLQLI